MRSVFVTALALLCMQASAQAQSQGVITGCIASATGSLYAVREGSTPAYACQKKDTPISWNKAGQQGPPGTSIPPLLEVPVNCGSSGTGINAALARQADKLIVSISGNCTEDVVITRDDVTLRGVGTDPTITAYRFNDGGMRIQGAQRVVLRDLTVTGGGVARVALWVDGGASVSAYNLKITGARNGLDVNANSWVSVAHSEIADNSLIGVGVSYGTVGISDSSIIDNRTYGLFLEGAVALLSRTTVTGGSAAIYNSVAAFQQCTLEQYMAVAFSRVEVAASLVTGRLDFTAGSAAMVVDTTIHGSIGAQGGSAVGLGGPVTIDAGGQPGISLSDTSTAGAARETLLTLTSSAQFGIFCAPLPSVSQITGGLVFTGSTNCPSSSQ